MYDAECALCSRQGTENHEAFDAGESHGLHEGDNNHMGSEEPGPGHM